MPGIDPNRHFIPVGIAVLTVSDTRNLETDRSGAILAERVRTAGHRLVEREIIPDEVALLRARITSWIDQAEIDVIISTGGTGLTARDITPEVFESLYEKPIPGFGELFRQLSYEIIGTSTIQSRATAGVSRGTYLFALPGSPGAVKDAWDGILSSQLDNRHRPCNLIEILPRLSGR